MRNMLKTNTLEQKFPLLAVENGCILSKGADITVAFRVKLPELFTVSATGYETLHSAWCKAIKVLPDYSIVLKQDWYCEEKYAPEISETEEMSFLSRSFQRHFNERPFLNHYCYLILTKTTKERSRQQSTFSSLARGFIVPKEVKDKESANQFLDAVSQFERILNDCGIVKLERLSTAEITGTENEGGIIEKYLALTQENMPVL
ncbi:MAG: TraG family conjugative transposon ATPase, partial [Draconibacterium sp.]